MHRERTEGVMKDVTLIFAERLFKMQNYYESVDQDVFDFLVEAYGASAEIDTVELRDLINVSEARRLAEPPQSIARNDPNVEVSPAGPVVFRETDMGHCSNPGCTRTGKLCTYCEQQWCDDCWEAPNHLDICEGLRGV